jgi:hypothetical protein
MGDSQNHENEKSVFFGLLLSGIGLVYVGIAIWGSEAGFHAPRWVVGLAGGTFSLGGLALLGQGYPHFSALVRALLFTAFGAVVTWVSFGTGERQFSSSISLPFISVSGPASELSGRICFAPGAILLDGLALYMWYQFVRDWFLRDLHGD